MLSRAPITGTTAEAEPQTILGEVLHGTTAEPVDGARPSPDLDPDGDDQEAAAETETRGPGTLALTWHQIHGGVKPFLWLPAILANGWLAGRLPIAWEPVIVSLIGP